MKLPARGRRVRGSGAARALLKAVDVYEGETMIRAILYDTKTGETQSGDERLVNVWKSDTNKLIWVDLFGEPEAKERELLEGRFRLHRLAVQDAIRSRHPPKLERFDD